MFGSLGVGRLVVWEKWTMKMTENGGKAKSSRGLDRRHFLKASLTGAVLGMGAGLGWQLLPGRDKPVTFIARASDYRVDFGRLLRLGLQELGLGPAQIRHKRVLLKPNLVEPHERAECINTHPQLVRGAAEAFLRLGAQQVLVAEGPGHRRDTLVVLEESGLAEVLAEDRIPFIDLNTQAGWTLPNRGGWTDLPVFHLPALLKQVDLIVSLAKMKTHHWAGVTLSMKNLFGVLPGMIYGWPKNVLHQAGLQASILDITASLRPQLAIVDGVIGDGPIMGSPKEAGVVIMGRSLPAVDSVCARIMGIDPYKIPYLDTAARVLDPRVKNGVRQIGERIADVQTRFNLLPRIHAQRGIRL